MNQSIAALALEWLILHQIGRAVEDQPLAKSRPLQRDPDKEPFIGSVAADTHTIRRPVRAPWAGVTGLEQLVLADTRIAF